MVISHCFTFFRNGDTILFTHEGGVDVGDVDAKALKLELGIDETPSLDNIKAKLLINVNKVRIEDLKIQYFIE